MSSYWENGVRVFSKPVATELPLDQAEELTRRAKKAGISRAVLVRKMVQAVLDGAWIVEVDVQVKPQRSGE